MPKETITTIVEVRSRIKISGRTKSDVQAAMKQIKIDAQQQGASAGNYTGKRWVEYDYETIRKPEVEIEY
jgi:hypothetical protein